MTHVRLPDGTEVTVHDTPTDWWEVDGATGYINPVLLIPDPTNPAKVLAVETGLISLPASRPRAYAK